MFHKYLIFLLIVGCGTDKKENSQAPAVAPDQISPKQESTNTSLAINASDIPECSDSNKNQLIYVLDLKEFQTCNVTWQKIEMPAGKEGAAGKDGNLLGAKAKYMCQGEIGTTGISYYYELTDMNDGSAYVFGEITDTTLSVSASRYFLSSQPGAKSGGVNMTLDLTGSYTGGSWAFNFVRDTKILTITAFDADLPDAFTTYTQAATECGVTLNQTI